MFSSPSNSINLLLDLEVLSVFQHPHHLCSQNHDLRFLLHFGFVLSEETSQDVMDAKEKLVARVKNHFLLQMMLSSATGRLLYSRILILVFFKLLTSHVISTIMLGRLVLHLIFVISMLPCTSGLKKRSKILLLLCTFGTWPKNSMLK